MWPLLVHKIFTVYTKCCTKPSSSRAKRLWTIPRKMVPEFAEGPRVTWMQETVKSLRLRSKYYLMSTARLRSAVDVPMFTQPWMQHIMWWYLYLYWTPLFFCYPNTINSLLTVCYDLVHIYFPPPLTVVIIAYINWACKWLFPGCNQLVHSSRAFRLALNELVTPRHVG